MNKEIEMLYKTLEAKDKIINKQALELADLKIENKKLRKSIYQAIIELDCMKSDAYYEDYDIKDEFYIKLMRTLGE